MLPNQSGESLAEVVVALAVGSVVILALVVVVITSLRNVQFARIESQATKYSQEGLEKIRSVRDRNGRVDFSSNRELVTKFGDLFKINLKQYCNPCTFKLNSDLSLTQTTLGTDTESLSDNMSRQIIISDDTNSYATEKMVVVKVKWTDSSGVHESNLQTILGVAI